MKCVFIKCHAHFLLFWCGLKYTDWFYSIAHVLVWILHSRFKYLTWHYAHCFSFLRILASRFDTSGWQCWGSMLSWYVGVLGMVWGVGWWFTTYKTPADHPRISFEEREYIEKALAAKGGRKVCTDIFNCLKLFATTLLKAKAMLGMSVACMQVVDAKNGRLTQ